MATPSKIGKFKLGDRVEQARLSTWGPGTIVDSSASDNAWLVRFDDPGTYLHNGNGVTKSGKRYRGHKCFFLPEEDLQLITGKATISRLVIPMSPLVLPPFKAGDLVKLSDYTEYEFPLHKGEIATITMVTSRAHKPHGARFSVSCVWPDGTDSVLSVDEHYKGAYKVDAAGEAIPIEKDDIVRLVKFHSGNSSVMNETGTVTRISPRGTEAVINFPSQGGYAAPISSLRLVKKSFKEGEEVKVKEVEVKNANIEEYKVGDKVRCVDSGAKTSEGGGGAGWEADKVIEIGKITKRGVETLLWPTEATGNTSLGIWASWVEPVTPKETTRQKPKEIGIPKKLNLKKHDIVGQDKIHKQLEVAVELNMPVLIVGDTGTGKTTIVKSLADKHEREYIRFNLTGETTVDEFVGKYVLRNEETVWEDGILLRAMKEGKWLIVDEVNVALPEILFVLHSLLDDDRSVMVANHKGELVSPHDNFRFFGTMNPVDEYAGTKDLNKAFKSRFGMILNMEYPATIVEAQIVQSKAEVSMEDAMLLVDVARKIRKAKEANEVFYTCSTRDVIQWGSLVGKLGVRDAFEVSILNKANGDRETVIKLYEQVVGRYKTAKAAGDVLNIEQLVAFNKEIKRGREELAKNESAIRLQIKEQLLKQLLDSGEKKAIPAQKLEKDLKKAATAKKKTAKKKVVTKKGAK